MSQSTTLGFTHAGAMDSSTTLQLQSTTRATRKPKRLGEGEELGKKPKKVNSELRKQQNRIASRNYREKRKRKLQYLQQLINEGSNDEQTPEPSPHQAEAHLRSISADRETAGPDSSPYMLPSSSAFPTLSPDETNVMGLIPIASTASLDSHVIPTSQAYHALEPSWNQASNDQIPSSNILWNGPAWIPDIDYSSRMVTRPDAYQYEPPTGPPVFAQNSVPYHQPQEVINSSDQYMSGSSYGHYYAPHSQPSVSLPTSASYFQGHVPRTH